MASTYSLREISDLKAGDHLCCLYETEEERRVLLTPLLRQGLERGEKVLYMVDAHTAGGVLGRLRDDGLEVEPYLASGQLNILTVEEAHLPRGAFDPDGAIALLRGETERALAEGYSALRLTEEMTWALRGLRGSEWLMEYEVRLNRFLLASKCLVICQYDRRRFEPAMLLDVLRTHPILLIGTESYDNLYYIPSGELQRHDLPAAELQHWMRNLAKRKRTEQALQISEERLRMLFEYAPCAYYLNDLRGNFVDGNRAAEEMIGCAREELLGKNFLKLDLLSPGQVPKAAALLAKNAVGQATGPDEFTLRRKGGDLVPVEIRTFPVKIGGQSLVLGIARDITERKRAEEKLKEYSEQLEKMVKQRTRELREAQEAMTRGHRLLLALGQAAQAVQRVRTPEEVYYAVGDEVTALGYHAMIFTLTDDRAHLTISHLTFEAARVRAAEKLIGLSAKDFRFPLVPDSLLQRVIAEGETAFGDHVGEHIAETLPKPLRPLAARIAAVLGIKQCIVARVEVGGETIGLLAVIGVGLTEDDMPAVATFANQMAIALENTQLYKEMGARAAELETAYRGLREVQEQLIRRERLAVLGQLAGGVGHELRNPLAAIKNAAYFLNIALEEPEPQVQETLEILEREVATSERIIASLLDFARPKPPSQQNADLNEIVQEALSRTAIPENVEVICQLDHALPTVPIDPDQIRQAFANITLNAVQAMPEGGELLVKSEVIDPEWVAVSFADTGVGIPEEHLGKLFEPLFTTKARGTGLGLAVSRTLVEGHGGIIEVESEVGKGSTFTVRLPINGEEMV